MNKTAITNFAAYLKTKNVSYTLDVFDTAVHLSVNGTPFAMELRSAQETNLGSAVISQSERVMVWGAESDSQYGDIPNSYEAMKNAYAKYVKRTTV